MNWYYANQGHQAGPVGDVELDELVRTGALPSSALVWSEGMSEWKPYSATRNSPTIAAGVAQLDDPLDSPPHGACICCHRNAPSQESVAVGANVVCLQCKTMFVERLREADVTNLPGALPYAGFWVRFAARMADSTVLALVQAIFTGSALTWALRRNSDAFTTLGITALAGIVMSAVYETALLSTRGATVGKWICYLRVVHADGSRIGVGTALGRYFAQLLSALTGGIGSLMAAFDIEKRALHDRVAGTRVINASTGESAQAKLEPVNRAIACATCETEIPLAEWNSLDPHPCPSCGTPIQAIVFPAVAHSLATSDPQAKEVEGEAGCFYHDSNRATLTCEECGRFLCPLCDFDSGARHLCPRCFNGHLNKNQTPEFVQRRTVYDSIALTGALLPIFLLFTLYFTVFTAPAVIGFSIWSWNKQSAITPRTRWRFIAAIIIAALNVLLVAAIVVTLISGAFK